MEHLPFVDIFKVFSNPISEEQAWAVCYQCAYFLLLNEKQEYYQLLFDNGIRSIWLNKQGDVLLREGGAPANGFGRVRTQDSHSHHLPLSPSPPAPSSSHSKQQISMMKRHVLATEAEAVHALGTAIFEALDYGIDQSEERQLSYDLESLISSMTMTGARQHSLEPDSEATNADDEGIEKDADGEDRCTVQDVIEKCCHHVSSKQDAQSHYKAVCRALVTEAEELLTFLEKISTSKEKLLQAQDEDSKRLEELRRGDWACLWSQVMSSLRQGVRLKKVEHVNLSPVEYELTPFEMLLEDIRSRRYTLHKIMVDGDIPSKVKSDAHAVILEFIRSRPPLRKVHDRHLKPRLPAAPGLHESLLEEIRSRPKLRPVRNGRVVVETSRSRLNSDDDLEPPLPVKRIIKPDLNLLLNNSFEESSGEEDQSQELSLMSSPVSDLSFISGTMTPPSPEWFRVENTFVQDNSGQNVTKLQRRHSISVCESPVNGKVASQDLPPLEEVEEPPPTRESHHFIQQSLSNSARHIVPSRKCFADNNYGHITLRNPHSQPRRASLEHRQSLTSLTSGLCAIPEIEDDPTGPESTAKPSNIVKRSWSHEQAPPPNLSPPFKGRARSAFSISMSSLKPMNRLHYPGSHLQHAHPFSPLNPFKLPTSKTSSSMLYKPARSTSVTSFFFQKIPSEHDESNTTTSSLSSSSSTYSDFVLPVSSEIFQNSISQKRACIKCAESCCHSENWKYPNIVEERLNNSQQDRNYEYDMIYKNFSNTMLEPVPHRAGMWGEVIRAGHTSMDINNVFVDKHMNSGRVESERPNKSEKTHSERFSKPEITDSERLSEPGITDSERLSKLDITDCERISKLDITDCERISKLDITDCERISKLDITDCERISKLDITDCERISKLDITDCERISKLDITDCERISKLDITDNEGRKGTIGNDRFSESEITDNERPSKKGITDNERLSKKGITEKDRHCTSHRRFFFIKQIKRERKVITMRRVKSFEKSKRNSKLRMLQEKEDKDLAGRTRKLGIDMSSYRQASSQESSVKNKPQELCELKSHNQKPPQVLFSEEFDVLGNKINDEDAGIASCYHVEETASSTVHFDDGLTQLLPSNQDNACDAYSSRLQLAASEISDMTASTTFSSLHEFLPLLKCWQNPVECLSLTLEEMTHIRSVLTKAELDSLIHQPDLYQQISKCKICFTCKTTKFTLFGEWGTKCKFCCRTVCSKCLRKMNVPTDHFRNVPVYTLCPSTLTPEMQELIRSFIKTAPPPSVPPTRGSSPTRSLLGDKPQDQHRHPASRSSLLKASQTDGSSKLEEHFGRPKSMHRSRSLNIPDQKQENQVQHSIKGPMMAICCDCKRMITEIVQVSRAALSTSSSSRSSASAGACRLNHGSITSLYLARK